MVEVFIEPELQELEHPTVAQEWFEICSELGLQSQLRLADRSEDKKAPPYMYVDPKTGAIIKTLCPVQIEYKKYKASTIPLDVLKEIHKCEKNNWYREIAICYDDKSPDPFVVGFTHDSDKWRSDIHLIARWGNELLPFEQLEHKALERVKAGATAAARELKQKMDTALENMDEFAKDLLNGTAIPQFSYSLDSIRKW